MTSRNSVLDVEAGNDANFEHDAISADATPIQYERNDCPDNQRDRREGNADYAEPAEHTQRIERLADIRAEQDARMARAFIELAAEPSREAAGGKSR